MFITQDSIEILQNNDVSCFFLKTKLHHQDRSTQCWVQFFINACQLCLVGCFAIKAHILLVYLPHWALGLFL